MSRKNNKGLTLIELLVTITIVLLVGSALLGFLQISSRLYRNNDEEVNLQYEAQTVLNKIQNMVMDSTEGISYTVGDDSYQELVSSDSEFKGLERTSIELTKKELYIFNIEKEEDTATEKKMVSLIQWDKETKELSYSQYEYKEDAEKENNTFLLAQYVKDFQLDLSGLETSRKLTLRIQMEKGTKSYETSTVVLLRNNVKLNQKAEDIFQEVVGSDSTITSVTISPSSVVTIQGGTVQFYATVLGMFSPNQNVSWQVTGTTDPQTKINQSTGILSLGAEETSQNIQVVAVSMADSTKQSTASTVMTRYFESITVSSQTLGEQSKDVGVTATINGKLLKTEHCSIEWQISTNKEFTDAKTVSVSNSTQDYDSSSEDGFSTFVQSGTLSLSGYPEGSTVYIRAVASKFEAYSKESISFTIPVSSTTTEEQIDRIEIKEEKVPDAPAGECYRGDTVSFSATVFNADNQVMSGKKITWSLVVKEEGEVVSEEVLSPKCLDNTLTFTVPDDGEGIKYDKKYSYEVCASLEKSNLSSASIGRTIPEVKISLKPHSDYNGKLIYLIKGKSLKYQITLTGIKNNTNSYKWSFTGSGLSVSNTSVTNVFQISYALGNEDLINTVTVCLKDKESISTTESLALKKFNLDRFIVEDLYIPTPDEIASLNISIPGSYKDLWGREYSYSLSGNKMKVNVGGLRSYHYNSSTKQWD